MFIGPALFLYLAFVIVPVFMTFYNSVHILHMSTWEQEYVGLEHYAELIPRLEPVTDAAEEGVGVLPFQLVWGDKIFQLAVKNSLTWAFLSPVLEIPIAFLLAWILFRRIPLARFFRIAWFTPILVSWVVVGVIFRWVFNNEWGVINSVLRTVGLGTLTKNWLGLPQTALPSLIAVTTWKFVGFNMVILLAALSSIPEELLDAARIDGTNRLQMIWYVILPLLQTTVVNLLILCFIGKMKQFALVWVTTRGGPMHHTETVATYVQRRAFGWRTLDLGYPSAIAVLWFIAIFALSLLFTRLLQRREMLEY
jgi:multiple sugar transport system permease protein/raffinose/stachyose/melibiose transport system permease protein